MRRTVRKAAGIALIALCSLALAGRPAVAAETISINGSGSALEMMKPLIAAYTKSHPDIRIVMGKPLGSSGAIKALLAGALDLAVSSKQLKPEEAARGAVAHEYGRTPLLIVTNMSVHKSNISTRELEDIYAGKSRNWPNGGTIRIVLRSDADIDTAILGTLSPGIASGIKTARQQPGMIVAVTDPESDEQVAKTSGAIGASALAGVAGGKLPLNVLSLNGVKGTPRTLAGGTYPLAKDIHFITTAKTPSTARKLLDFIYSPSGRAIAEKAGVLVPASTKTAR